MNKDFEVTTIQKRAVLITTVLTAISFLAFLALLLQLAINDTTAVSTQTYIAVGLVGLLSVSAGLSAWHCRNGRVKTGMSVVGAGFLLIILAIPFFTKGRSAYASPLAVALVVAIVPQLFSIRIANRVVTAFVIAGLVSIGLDIWLPLKRVTPNVPPIAIYIFIAGLFVFILFTALQFRKFNLQTKLLSFLVFMPLLIVAVAGIFLIVRIASQQRAEVEADIELVLSERADDISRFNKEAEADIHLLSQSFALRNYLSVLAADAPPEALAGAKANVQEAFLNYAQTRLFYDQISFIDANGQEAVRVDTDLNGVSSVIFETDLQNKADQPYFLETIRLDSGNIFVSPLELNVERGEIERPYTPVLRYGTPVYWEGQLQGIIVTHIFASAFLEQLANNEQDIYLIDQDGYFLFHSDESKMWGRDLGTGIAINQEMPTIAPQLMAAAPEPVTVQVDTNLVTQVPITLGTETEPRWFLVNVTPIAAIVTPINETLQPVQFVLAAALMLTPLLALFISQSIASPIVRLSESAEQMGQGNFDLPIQVNSSDEVGILAATLKSMSAELAEQFDLLESRVARRTSDLTLVVEVSRQVSQVQALETLLTKAVTLIRDRFDLYYTQIYLVDGNTLHLEAGTGEVGRHLLRRGHKLPIGPGSINGTAVSEKRSLIVADTTSSPLFRPNQLLPDTRSEMAIPLIAKDVVVGVLNLQSSQPDTLTEENLFAFEALAGQLASAIENARLFAEVGEARSALEAQMKRLTRQGWDSYLDGIHHREFVGFSYEDGKIKEVTDPTPDHLNQQKWPIQLLNDKLGQIVIDLDPEHPLSKAEIELINNVSTQVGQQIDNLRLLADARRYQEEAEQMARRLIRDGWKSYRKKATISGYTYNQQEVSILDTPLDEPEDDIVYPISLGGEPIGEIALSGVAKADEQTQEIITAVTTRLGTHIENLRLTEQSEIARAISERHNRELAIVNRMMTEITSTLDLNESMHIVAKELMQALSVAHVGIALLTEDKKFLRVVTEYPLPEDNSPEDVIDTLLPIKGYPLTEQAIETRRFVVAYDAQNNRLTAPIHALLRQRGVHTLAVLPMIIAGQFFGTVGFDLLDPDHIITDEEIRLAETIVYQAATVVQNARLFAQTQEALAETNEQARRLALLNEMSETISRQSSVEDIVATVMQKVSEILEAVRISLHLIDSDDTTMLRVAGVAGEVADVAASDSIPLQDSPMAAALETRQLVSGFFDTGAEKLEAFFAPLFAGNQPLGTFNIAVSEKTRIKENDRQILMQIASILGTTLENRQLFDQAQARAERERLLNKIVTQVAASLDLQHSLQIIVDELATAVNVDQVRVALIQPESNQLLIIAEHFHPSTPSAVGVTIPIEGNALTQEVIDTRKMIMVEDAQNNPRTAPVHDLFRVQGIETVVLLPLVVKDEVIGTIGLDILDERSIDQDTLQLTETIVYQAAIAIQNARLFEQSQAALAETETLYAYTSQLNTATNLNAVLESAAAPGFQIGAADALLLVYDQDTSGQAGYGQIMASSPKNSGLMGKKLLLNEQPFSRLWPSGGKNILFVGDVTEERRLSAEDRAAFLEIKVQALAIMFLSVGNLQLGQIIIRWHNKQTFTLADERLYGAITQQASSVIYNRLLFNQTEEALSETAALYQASVDLNAAETYEQILNALRQHTILGQGSSDVTLNFFNRVWTPGDLPETVDVLARWTTLSTEPPNQYKLAVFPEAEQVLKPDEWLICADVETDERMGEKTRAIFMNRFKAKSLLFVPLVVSGQWIGFLNGVYAQPRQFPEAQIRRLNVLARQAAVSVRSLQLLAQTRRRADREALINSINKKIQSAPTVQFALQTAVTELSQALKLKKAVIELTNDQPDDHNHQTNGSSNGSELS
jgi:GAF domain-containing protein